MARKADVPNAWDDNWEAEADKTAAKDTQQPSNCQQIDGHFNDDEKDTPFSGGALLAQPPADEAKPVLLSRAERLAQHAEKNRKLWETADNPEEFHFLSAGGPSTSNNTGSSAPTILSAAAAFRPAMTVLSRKPAPQMIRRRDPVTGLEQLTIRDDAADAEAEAIAAAARKQESPEQVRQRQMKEREERQRKYDEARAKIFGEPLPSSSPNSSSNNNKNNADNVSTTNTSTPGSMASSRQTSPTPKSGNNSNQKTPLSPQSHGGRGRGRGRGQGGSYRGDRGGAGNGHSTGNGNDGTFSRRGYHHHHSNSNGQPSSAAGHCSPSSAHTPSSQKLFDPNYSPKPGPRRQGGSQIYNGLSRHSSNGNSSEPSPFPSRTGTPREDDLVARAPRGPDGTGRGGFGFSRRGG